VGNFVIDVVAKYDVKVILYLLLLQVYFHLNFVKTIIKPTTLENDCFFGQIVLL
jgi:hypothetical protein